MFDGTMPPLASPAKTRVFSGFQSIAPVAGLALPTDGAAVGVVQGRFSGNRGIVLSLGFPVGGIIPGVGFPPYPTQGANIAPTDCGLVDGSNTQLGVASVQKLACVLEYGCGSSQSKVYMDYQPGSYNLPPSEFVRVSALPWGTGWTAGGTFPAVASLAEGELQDSYPPVASGWGAFDAGVSKSFPVPAQARAVEIVMVGNLVAATIQLTGAVTATRNYATGQFVPGWSPLDILSPGAQLAVVSDLACVLQLKWYLAL